MTFRVRYVLRGGHYHCRLFASASGASGTFAKCGEFVIREGEFEPLKTAMTLVQFMPED